MRGAVGAEVRVDRTFLQHARRRSVAVDGVAERFGIGVFEEQLVMQHFAVGGVDDVEVLLLAVFRGGGKPEFAVADDRRGMSFAFERNLPGDIFLCGFVPSKRQAGGFGERDMPVGGRSAFFRPRQIDSLRVGNRRDRGNRKGDDERRKRGNTKRHNGSPAGG